MRYYHKILLVFSLIMGCMCSASNITAQSNSAQSQWNRIVEAELSQPLQGTQTVVNTAVTLLDGYADARLIMIHFAITGEMPPLAMNEHTFITDNGSRITPLGAFSVELGEVVVFRNPGVTSGTLETFVVSARNRYDSQTGEYTQGDGTRIGPFNIGFTLTANTQVSGSGRGSVTNANITVELTNFYRTPSGVSATICHNQANHAFEEVTLESGSVVVPMSNATLPFNNLSNQTCQTIGFIQNLDQLGSTAVLRIASLKDVSYWAGQPDIATEHARARRIVELLRQRGYDAQLFLFDDGGYSITGGVPQEVWRAVNQELNNHIDGNWTFNVTMN